MSERTANRERQWIRDAFDRYEGPLVRYTLRLTGDLETARDVVQDAFVRLCRQPRARVESHVAAWLFTVCRRRALDVARKQSRMHSLADAPEVAGADGRGELDRAERHEAVGQVLKLLDTLPARQQEVVRLKFQNSLSYREISRVTGLSVSNVGYLIHTAITNIRRLLLLGTAQK